MGVAVRKDEQEGRLVVFRGGWADLDYWSGRPSDALVSQAPGWGDWLDLPGIEQLLHRFAALFGDLPAGPEAAHPLWPSEG